MPSKKGIKPKPQESPSPTLATETAAAHIRAVDVLARYGGDEFVVLLPQTNAQRALSVAEHIRQGIAALRQETDRGLVSVTVSTGIAEVRLVPPDRSIEDIVRHADEALYESKAVGRNCTRIFYEEPKEANYDRG